MSDWLHLWRWGTGGWITEEVELEDVEWAQSTDATGLYSRPANTDWMVVLKGAHPQTVGKVTHIYVRKDIIVR